ncbi:hypothetical protein [Lysobacter gummosus]|uniref:hypothetical protein n=1 Tax=Lysobacter gummosus TaxID=262324 RepID=UPI0036396A81
MSFSALSRWAGEGWGEGSRIRAPSSALRAPSPARGRRKIKHSSHRAEEGKPVLLPLRGEALKSSTAPRCRPSVRTAAQAARPAPA